MKTATAALAVLCLAPFARAEEPQAPQLVAKYDEYPFVPNNLIGFHITEGPL